MKELFKTNNAVRLSFAEALLRDQGLKPIVFDRHMSILDGSIGALPRRLMVADEDYAAAVRVLIDAGLMDGPVASGEDLVQERRGELESLGALSDDGLLGGRLHILQPRDGFRAAVDSVLLPAAVSPANGLDILDAGIGAGVGALCLLARAPSFRVTGIEIQNELAALARENARRNGLSVDVYYGDLIAEIGSGAGMQFDQVMTNPPYLDEARATLPTNPSKARSQVLPHADKDDALHRWIGACFKFLKPHGVLTLIHRADRLNEILSILAGRAASTVLPVLPKTGDAPHRVLVQARLGARGETRVLPGLVLHGLVEKYTPEAEAILRHAGALDWGHDIKTVTP